MSALDRLRESGIPLDWTTVMVGYFGCEEHAEAVSAEEVIDLATSTLVSTEEPPSGPLTQLACARPNERDLLTSCLISLSETCGCDREVAGRKWRYLGALELVELATRANEAFSLRSLESLQPPPRPTLLSKLFRRPLDSSSDEWDERYSALYCTIGDIYRFWAMSKDVPAPIEAILRPPEPASEPYTPEQLRDLLAIHEQWLAEEFRSLRDAPCVPLT